MPNFPSSDWHSQAAQALRESREHRDQKRFRQLNDLVIGHAEGSLQYLLAVKGGGCIAMLGLVGAASLFCFIGGAIAAGYLFFTLR